MNLDVNLDVFLQVATLLLAVRDVERLCQKRKQFKFLFKFLWIINQHDCTEFRHVFARAALVLAVRDVGRLSQRKTV